MADSLVVFNNIQDWFPPVVIQKDLITVPRINIDLKLPYPEGVLAKGQEFIKKAFNPKFDAEFPKVSKKVFSQMQSLIDAFQKEINDAKANPAKSKITEASLKKDLAALNTKLEFCVDQWKKAVEKVSVELFDEAVEKWDKEAKAKIKRAKTKVIIKAVVLAALVLTAAALAIVAVVATGGAAAVLIPAIVVASAAALGSVVKLYKEMTSGFAARAKLCDDKVKEVKADLMAIDKVMEKLTDPSVNKVSIRQKYQVGTSLLEKHLGQLEKFHRDLAVQVADLEKKVDAQKAILDKAKDDPKSKPVLASIELLQSKIAALKKRTKDLVDLQKVANDTIAVMNASVEKGLVPKYDRLRKVIDAFGQTSDFFTAILDSGGKVAKAAADYDKALKAAAKK